jgi:hypothetical protein
MGVLPKAEDYGLMTSTDTRLQYSLFARPTRLSYGIAIYYGATGL